MEGWQRSATTKHGFLEPINPSSDTKSSAARISAPRPDPVIHGSRQQENTARCCWSPEPIPLLGGRAQQSARLFVRSNYRHTVSFVKFSLDLPSPFDELCSVRNPLLI
jgi:hypothetical protein